MYQKESFIGFYGSTASNTPGLVIPNYPNKVHKLYDNDFFDPKNGNILRVYAAAYDNVSQDTTGATIDHIDIIDRSGKTTSFKKDQQITTTTLSSVPNSYLSWSAYSADSGFSNITSNQLLYCAWGQNTYIHILDLNNNLNACGFLYSGTGEEPIYTNFNTTLSKLTPTSSSSSTAVADSSNDTAYTYDSEIKQVVYQLTPNIAYIPSNGDIRIIDNSNKKIVYNRAGQSMANYSAVNAIKSATTPWTEFDLVGNYLMVYIPNQTKTTILILNKNNDGVSYNMVSVYRFNADGSIQMDANTVIQVPTNFKVKSSPVSSPAGSPASADGLYNTIISSLNNNFTADEQERITNGFVKTVKGVLGTGGSNFGYNQNINDYILKTNLVAPVCPACPQCPNFPTGTTCTSCGSTTTTKTSSPASSGSPSGKNGSPSGIYQDLKRIGGETKDLIEDAASGTVGVGRDLASGTVGLGKEVASGTVGVGREVASGTLGVGREVASGTLGVGRELASGTLGVGRELASGTVGLGKEIVGGTVGAIKGVGSDIAGLFKEDPSSVGGGPAGAGAGAGVAGSPSSSAGYYGQNAKGTNNPWTYNGALSEKPSSEFIPITADFSKFGR